MARNRDAMEEDHPTTYAKHLETKGHEVWWYRKGAYIATAIVAAALWYVVIGPKVSNPKTEMVDPATEALATGLKQPKDVTSLSKELHFNVAVPDLRQLGGKLTRIAKSEFGGQTAAVMQYQYGKSVLLLYNFNRESKQFKEMRRLQAGKSLFYISSGGAVSVVAWKDLHSGYFALAAKATEKDLVNLAGKVVAQR